MISSHSDLEEYNETYDQLMTYYLQKEFILEEPVTLTINIPDSNISRKYEFLDVLTKKLESEDDDEDE